MFQGDFLTKITLRFHRSHLWCEGNLAPTVESMMLLRHPGYKLPSLRDEEILRRCFVGETMHKSVFLRQLRHAVREDFFPDGEGVEDFFGFSGVR